MSLKVVSVPAQFDASVSRFPERLAVSDRGSASTTRYTYRQLDELSRRAAGFLAATGLQAGDRCAILAENGARWCAAYLGALRLGAIVVPLDTSYSADQIQTLLRDAGARLLLASARFAAPAREAAAAGVRVLDLDDAAAHQTAHAGESPAQPDDSAVILYTSGTTADPKGVVLTHANLLAEKDAAFAAIPVGEDDAVLGVLPLFHALAQFANLLLPLAAGAHVVFLETLGSRELLRALEEERISVFVCVPQFFYLIHQRVMAEVAKGSVLRRLIFRALLRGNAWLRRRGRNAGPWLFGRVHRTLGPRMRLLITGGSKFDAQVGRDLDALGLTILQAYGLTETSGAATVTRPGEPVHTVGQPLPGVEIRIDGATEGEVLVRGPIVMRGYWNRPDATAAVLREGWLRTGDLGRLDGEGRLEITGRSKEVIVLGSGKNIHPEEIEAHYRQSAIIRELCVLGVAAAGAPASERLHALVVPDLDVMRERRIVNTVELVRFELEGLSVSLPPHKRVLGFDVTLEPLPRTTTGKLRRHEVLRRLQAAGARREAPPPVAPADAHEARVVALVQAAVRPGVAVRPDSNLELDLGLDSMERVELLASVEQRFGIRVPEAVAQSAFHVRDLAEALRGGGGGEPLDESGTPWETLLDEAGPAPEWEWLRTRQTPVAWALFAVLRILVRLLARPVAKGLEHLPARGPYILSPNHQSYLDPFVLVGVLPFAVYRETFFVGAAEYFATPLLAWLARLAHVVPVDPDANLVPAMRAGAYGLRAGRILVLFPEGERSIDGEVKKFKKGAAILSQHLQVPIVPVAIDGVFEIWPRNRGLDWRRLLPWSGHAVRIQVGPPLPPAAGSYAERTAALRDAVQRMWLAISASGSRSA